MAGMRMDSSHSAQVLSQNPGTHPQSLPAPCRFPWAPDGCQSMVPCSPAAVASTVAQVEAITARHGPITAWTWLTPPSVSSAPELPPPRA